MAKSLGWQSRVFDEGFGAVWWIFSRLCACGSVADFIIHKGPVWSQSSEIVPLSVAPSIVNSMDEG